MPTVVIVSERFVGLAQAVMTGEGVPDQPAVHLPGNPEFMTEAELVAAVEGVVDDLVSKICSASVEVDAVP